MIDENIQQKFDMIIFMET